MRKLQLGNFALSDLVMYSTAAQERDCAVTLPVHIVQQAKLKRTIQFNLYSTISQFPYIVKTLHNKMKIS